MSGAWKRIAGCGAEGRVKGVSWLRRSELLVETIAPQQLVNAALRSALSMKCFVVSTPFIFFLFCSFISRSPRSAGWFARAEDDPAIPSASPHAPEWEEQDNVTIYIDEPADQEGVFLSPGQDGMDLVVFVEGAAVAAHWAVYVKLGGLQEAIYNFTHFSSEERRGMLHTVLHGFSTRPSGRSPPPPAPTRVGASAPGRIYRHACGRGHVWLCVHPTLQDRKRTTGKAVVMKR